MLILVLLNSASCLVAPVTDWNQCSNKYSCGWISSIRLSFPHLTSNHLSRWCFLSQATTFVKWLKNNAWLNLLPPWRWSPSLGPAELPWRSACEESARGRREVRMWGHVTCICFLDGWRRRRRSQKGPAVATAVFSSHHMTITTLQPSCCVCLDWHTRKQV